MKTLTTNWTQRILTLFKQLALLALFPCVLFTAATYADDTEIFVKSSTYEGAAPNVLIMLDSSSSMNQSIEYVDGYDATVATPAAASAPCDESKIYVKTGTNNQLPSCGNNSDTILVSAMRCRDIVEFMLEVGSLNDRVHQWDEDSGTWGAFGHASNANMETAPIECLNDQGKHGDLQILTAASGQVELDTTTFPIKTTPDPYITNSGPVDPDSNIKAAWSETEDTSIVWGDDKFVTFYTGHFLNYAHYVIDNKNDPAFADAYHSTSGVQLAITAMSQIVDEYDDFNMGIARYNAGGNKTASILMPVVPLDDSETKLEIIGNYIEAFGKKDGTILPNSRPTANYVTTEDNSFSGGQPMASGQYEAYRYFRGLSPHGGGTASQNFTLLDADPQPHPPTTNIPSAIDSNGEYISPIDAIDGVCQGNYVLYLTASGTSSDQTAPQINDAIGWTADGTQHELEGNHGKCGQGNDECLDDLTQFMYEHDLRDDIANGIDENGDPVLQNVTTYGISINASAEDLDEAAVLGGGKFRKAENPGAITALLREVLNEIIGQNTTFVAPSISVNNFNRLENRDELYYSLFTPTETRVWEGNLKKYKFDDGEIIDANTVAAIDPATGSFYDYALSFWTDSSAAELQNPKLVKVLGADGNVSGLGGFASRLTTTSRKVYTHKDDNVGLLNLDLSQDSKHKLHETDNNYITKSLLGDSSMSDEYFTELVRWGRGVVVTTDGTTTSETSTKFVGDLLHTTPAIISYNTGTAENPVVDQALFFGTNNGFIHGVNADPQTLTENMEYFAYAPYETLVNLDTYYTNEESIDKLYGIDGPVTFWNNDIVEENLLVDSGETAMLYATQRRGGRNIYAMDVSDYNNPELVWKIRGGQGDFTELGQTWSAVQHASIANADPTEDPIDVVIFAGGYDENQDTLISATAPASALDASMGRAVYIVNANTGELLWHASHDQTGTTAIAADQYADMQYAIPSDIRIIDSNYDGHSDRLYFGDLGGQVWRFDIDNYVTNSDEITASGGVLAKLSPGASTNTNTGLTNIRFFSAPSVAPVDNSVYGRYLSIAIGSGYRAHPLDEVLNDKFYMLKDYAVNNKPDFSTLPVIYDNGDTTAPTTHKLLDVTSIAQAGSQLKAYGGFVIDLNSGPGEKILNPAITGDNKIFFTTYVPESESAPSNSCAPNAQLGKSKLYAVSLFDGGVTDVFLEETYTIGTNEDGDIVVTTSDGDTYVLTDGDEIVTNPDGSVVIVFDDGTEVTILDAADSDQDTGNRSTDLNEAGISANPVFVFETGDTGGTNVSVLIGKEAVDPSITNNPVKTYWHRME
ncbi:MAG: hypothetical protein HKN88_06300 [Gammaproteobacteria bacterium]|nr:hypothetical protein [Gammaproteobacteria bacterium]